VVKIVLSRRTQGRGYAMSGQRVTRRVVSAHAMPGGVETLREKGVLARTLELRLATQPALGGIKHLNRLEQVLASRELESTPGMEGILLDRDDHLISTVAANLFLVLDGNLMTPRMDRCGVRGVVRGLVVRDFKPRCELRRITADMLLETDEAFLSSSVRGIVPLLGIDDIRWPIGPVTRELQAWFEQRAAAT
jgi:4-amino-4-deoxychorismate lyase